jgi:hypothetical protein
MVKSIATVLTPVPAGTTQLLNLNIPQGEKWKILDIRVPFSTPEVALVIVAVDNDDRFMLIGTDAENTYTINEEYTGPHTISARIVCPAGSAILSGLVIMYDDGRTA